MNWIIRKILGIILTVLILMFTPAELFYPEDGSSTAYYQEDDVSMIMELPEGWDYTTVKNDPNNPREVEYCGIAFWHESFDAEKEAVWLLYYPGGFYPPLSYKRTDYVLENGANVRVGVRYEHLDVWDYIYFLDEEDSYVLLAEGTKEWWPKYGEECTQIINSIRIE